MGPLGNQPYYLSEAKTKRACLEWIDEAAKTRRELAEHQRQRAERIAAAGWARTTLTDIEPAPNRPTSNPMAS